MVGWYAVRLAVCMHFLVAPPLTSDAHRRSPQDQAGEESIPPTFRMYTTGGIVDAFGREATLRTRAGIFPTPEEVILDVAPESAMDDRGASVREPTDAGASHAARVSVRRELASLVELQVAWAGGYTHLLCWLDHIRL